MQPLATVLRVDRKRVLVDLVDGTVLECSLRSRVHRDRGRAKSAVAVGDRVRVERQSDDTGVIEEVLPRTTVLMRPEVVGRWHNQVLVANADRAVLVFAYADPPPAAGLVDRLLVACHAGDVPPLLVFNKCDLEATEETRAVIAVYEELGYEVLHTSAARDQGIDRLRELVTGRQAVVAGPSGTGKSSLLNRVLPGLELRTAEISATTRKGTHTTTAARLVRMPGGGHMIDTPGIKEFGIRAIPLRELALCFPEFDVPGQCRFADCIHVEEPGCAVRRQVEEEGVHASRYAAYLALLEELRSDTAY